jgi:hypothetical protein
VPHSFAITNKHTGLLPIFNLWDSNRTRLCQSISNQESISLSLIQNTTSTYLNLWSYRFPWGADFTLQSRQCPLELSLHVSKRTSECQGQPIDPPMATTLRCRTVLTTLAKTTFVWNLLISWFFLIFYLFWRHFESRNCVAIFECQASISNKQREVGN